MCESLNLKKSIATGGCGNAGSLYRLGKQVLFTHFVVAVNHAVDFLHIASGVAADDEGGDDKADGPADGSPFDKFLHGLFVGCGFAALFCFRGKVLRRCIGFELSSLGELEGEFNDAIAGDVRECFLRIGSVFECFHGILATSNEEVCQLDASVDCLFEFVQFISGTQHHFQPLGQRCGSFDGDIHEGFDLGEGHAGLLHAKDSQQTAQTRISVDPSTGTGAFHIAEKPFLFIKTEGVDGQTSFTG